MNQSDCAKLLIQCALFLVGDGVGVALDMKTTGINRMMGFVNLGPVWLCDVAPCVSERTRDE